MSSRNLARLYGGLVLFGISLTLMLRAGLGLGPWDVLHQGISRHTGISIGLVANLVAVAVLLLWIPLRQRPGLGTVSNVIVVGLVTDATLALTAPVHDLAARTGLLVAGILANAVATGLYVGAGFGPGPRDGLMTGLAARGHSLRLVRTSIELTALGAGWLLGGTVGPGTLAYALAIGPLVGWLMPRLAVTPRNPRGIVLQKGQS
ncbi:YitT family protein [Dactylosporangium cerinum]|uniref:YitT family protein n=1 Tax=Dactylosporangium cerinum TaxID=1434730 RepID=A0ABV9WB38_9ACTN